MSFTSGIFLFLFCLPAFGAMDIAASMVPRGKIDEKLGRDFMVRTKAGTRVGIEFTRKGKFQEAFGKNLNKGDELEPGDGLISLSTAARSLKKAGVDPEGYWVLEEDPDLGWVYEVKDVIISARSGEVLNHPIIPNTAENTK